MAKTFIGRLNMIPLAMTDMFSLLRSFGKNIMPA